MPQDVLDPKAIKGIMSGPLFPPDASVQRKAPAAPPETGSNPIALLLGLLQKLGVDPAQLLAGANGVEGGGQEGAGELPDLPPSPPQLRHNPSGLEAVPSSLEQSRIDEGEHEGLFPPAKKVQKKSPPTKKKKED